MTIILRHKLKRGQSLFEIIVAMGIMAIFGVAIVSAVLVTQKATISAANKVEATKYAQQTFEKLRASRNVQGLKNIFSGGPYTIVNNTSKYFCMTLTGTDPTTWDLTSTNGNTGYTTGLCSSTLALPLAGPFSYVISYNCARNIVLPNPPDPDYGNCSSATSTKAVLTVTIFWQEAGQQNSTSETETLYDLSFGK